MDKLSETPGFEKFLKKHKLNKDWDRDGDGIPFSKDYAKVTNNLIPGDSGGPIINSSGSVECLIALTNRCEPLKDIQFVYKKFKKQADEKGYKILEKK